ncbi:MAG: glutathione S-transferase N-terminal domain-containing protein [Rickettsiales bacterium]|nr:glutathione S-transferase N-terminal domain-containing protein [Rickettsiales bacterium]
MKLYYTKRSPYATKVRAVAKQHGIELELIEVADLSKKTPELLAANFIGKVPALVLNSGESIFDSPVICQYLDEIGKGKKLIPALGVERYRVLKIEAAADSVMDSCVAIFFEGLRPEEQRSEAIVERHVGSINRVLEYFNNNIKEITGELNLGMIALASGLGYINLRFREQINFEVKYPALKNWYEGMQKHQSISETAPKVCHN